MENDPITIDSLADERIRKYWTLARDRIAPGTEPERAAEISVSAALKAEILTDVMLWSEQVRAPAAIRKALKAETAEDATAFSTIAMAQAMERQAEIAQSALEVEREKLAAIREQTKIMRELWLKLAEMGADIDLIEQHLKGLGTIFNDAAEV